MSSIQQVIDSADDKVFASFCRTIKVNSIREYEERQLKVLQEGSDVRMRFNTQIKRLTHQLSPSSFSMFNLLKSTKNHLRRRTAPDDQG